MSPQLLSITRQISTLPWRDRLTLLGHVFRSLFSASSHIPAMTPPESSTLAQKLSELQHICAEESYTLEVPNRENRVSPFGDR
jgi:hypothetical protein